MKTIQVQASKSYPVIVGEKLLPQLGKYITEHHKPKKAAIISDTNVWPLYGEKATDSLTAEDIETVHFVFPAGEASKNAETYIEILNFLAENQLTRSDVIIALGGGVVGDITGFSAATYLRGIAYIQVPTSLLAMVDSSVGGKTAIDLPAGKNLAGAFYQPNLVLCDTDVLQSLPQETFRDGCAEIVKYGILYDAKLFDHLTSNGLSFDRETVIARCVELKRDVVAQDEFDTGARQKLNLGHTFGHAVEALSQFSVTHGCAVAIGMAIMARAAEHRGHCSAHTAKRIISLLEEFALPTNTSYTSCQIASVALTDKKRTADTVNLIIPKEIGACMICKIPISQLESFIKVGL